MVVRRRVYPIGVVVVRQVRCAVGCPPASLRPRLARTVQPTDMSRPLRPRMARMSRRHEVAAVWRSGAHSTPEAAPLEAVLRRVVDEASLLAWTEDHREALEGAVAVATSLLRLRRNGNVVDSENL